MPEDPLNLLRVVSLLVFMSAFLGIALSLLRPGAKRQGHDNAMIPLREDAVVPVREDPGPDRSTP